MKFIIGSITAGSAENFALCEAEFAIFQTICEPFRCESKEIYVHINRRMTGNGIDIVLNNVSGKLKAGNIRWHPPAVKDGTPPLTEFSVEPDFTTNEVVCRYNGTIFVLKLEFGKD